MNKLEQEFETWWEREGQEFLYALNTTTDDDIKLVAEVAWKNGAYCAKHPVRTKDLTDDEIRAIRFNWERNEFAIDFARAVIAADREKNK